MKQVKKLLVILPLVALFVLGSLPVAAIPGREASQNVKLQVRYLDADGKPSAFGDKTILIKKLPVYFK